MKYVILHRIYWQYSNILLYTIYIHKDHYIRCIVNNVHTTDWQPLRFCYRFTKLWPVSRCSQKWWTKETGRLKSHEDAHILRLYIVVVTHYRVYDIIQYIYMCIYIYMYIYNMYVYIYNMYVYIYICMSVEVLVIRNPSLEMDCSAQPSLEEHWVITSRRTSRWHPWGKFIRVAACQLWLVGARWSKPKRYLKL